jgi:hypothetical protein
LSDVNLLRPDAITEMMGTVRFSKIVEVAGKPIVHVLWIDPSPKFPTIEEI